MTQLMLIASGIVNLNGRPVVLQWGVLQISLANFIVIATMLVVFIVAVIVPFPKGKSK